MRGEIISWVGGSHEFALSVPDLEALQSRCGGDGVGEIHHRLSVGRYSVQDVLATVSLGLESSEITKIRAVEMTRDAAEDHGLNKLSLVALAVLSSALHGWPEDDLKDQGDALGGAGVETPES